jgi:hypothetical protein
MLLRQERRRGAYPSPGERDRSERGEQQHGTPEVVRLVHVLDGLAHADHGLLAVCELDDPGLHGVLLSPLPGHFAPHALARRERRQPALKHGGHLAAQGALDLG